MSNFGKLAIDSRSIYLYHGRVPVKVLSLFTETESVQIKDMEWRPNSLVFEQNVRVLRDRLDAVGFGESRVQEAFVRLRAREVQDKASYRSTLEWSEDYKLDLKKALDQKINYLRNLTYEEWKAGLHDCMNRGEIVQEDTLDTLPTLPDDDLDELVPLRVICSQLDDSLVVTLDLNPLLEGVRTAAYLDEPGHDVPFHTIDVEPPSPVVIITEGSFDAEVLRGALPILRPHLVRYIKFLDDGMGHEGSASSAVRTLRSFAAAGVSNRVVAILDNDSAAHQEAMSLSKTKLPAQYRLLHYPDVDHLREYPTLGPTGSSTMDVNGLAGSIELYLGSDVLTLPDGDFSPVQWTGYQARIRRYQGVVCNKNMIQRRFRAKLSYALRNPKSVNLQDWSSLELIIGHIMNSLAELK